MQIAPPTARRAGQLIAVVTVLVALAGGLAITLLDRDEFPTLGSGMWWSLQTITTVGYGDHVPEDTFGQIVAGLVMVTGIGFISVVTASISAAFVESARKRRGRDADDVVSSAWSGSSARSRSSRRTVRARMLTGVPGGASRARRQRPAGHADAARALRGRAGRGRVAVDRQP